MKMKNKIKVLRIMHRINIGGPTYHAAYLTNGLNNHGFETKLISGNIDENEKNGEYILIENNVKVTYVKSMYRKISIIRDIKSYFQIKKIIKEYQPDIVHTHAAKSGAIGRLAAILSNVPIIIHTFHGHTFHSYFNKFKTYIFIMIEKFLASKSTKIIAISNLQKLDLIKYKICEPKKISVINLGFDLKKFSQNTAVKRKIFRDEFNLKDDEIAIGIIGRLDPIKNHKLFIESIKYVNENSNKKVRAFVVGDGQELDNLKKLCSELNLGYNTNLDEEFNEMICFTSWRNDIDIINSGLDIITLTSLNEGTPVSLIEAQASSKPIVSTNVGGIKDIVLKDESALICDNSDGNQFKLLLLKCVNDKSLRDYLSSNGYEFVINRYTKENLINNIANLYNELYEK